MYWIGPTQVVVNTMVKMTATVVLSITINVTYHNRIMTVAMTVATMVTVERGEWVQSTQTIVQEDSHLVQCIGCPCRKVPLDCFSNVLCHFWSHRTVIGRTMVAMSCPP